MVIIYMQTSDRSAISVLFKRVSRKSIFDCKCERKSITTLEAVMRVSFLVLGRSKYFEPSNEMLEMFNSESVYKSDFKSAVFDEILLWEK